VEPRNDVVWETWIAMEDELGAADVANELRVRRAERQWEFVIPANFTTRPETALGSLLSTLNTFFSQRTSAAGGAKRDGGGGRSPSRSLRELLPEDYIADLQLDLEDLLPSAAAENAAEAALQRLPAPGVKLEGKPSPAGGGGEAAAAALGARSSSSRGRPGGRARPAPRRPGVIIISSSSSTAAQEAGVASSSALGAEEEGGAAGDGGITSSSSSQTAVREAEMVVVAAGKV
jgi:hypothetical protein